MPYSPPEPRWDIVEEHLDEAEFLWGMWEHGLRAPNYGPADVARGPEARLAAQVDGLLTAGPAAHERLLLPALTGEPRRASAAAATLLAAPGERGVAAVFAAWQAADERGPLARALACSDRPEVVTRLRAELDAGEAAAAEVLIAMGEPLGDALGALLASDDAHERALGLRASADEARPEDHRAAIEAALTEVDPVVLDAAIVAGARLGLASAWQRARARAEDRGGDEALLLLALADAPADRPLLQRVLLHKKRRAAGLWALGFVGKPEVVDLCAEWLEDDRVGRLAGEVVTAVTGVDLAAAGLSVRGRERVALAHVPEDSLPRPDPMKVLAWWVAHRERFAAGRRYLGGAPRTQASLLAGLAGGSMRRRGGWLLDLQLRARTPLVLRTLAPIARQRRQLAEVERRLAQRPVDVDRSPG